MGDCACAPEAAIFTLGVLGEMPKTILTTFVLTTIFNCDYIWRLDWKSLSGWWRPFQTLIEWKFDEGAVSLQQSAVSLKPWLADCWSLTAYGFQLSVHRSIGASWSWIMPQLMNNSNFFNSPRPCGLWCKVPEISVMNYHPHPVSSTGRAIDPLPAETVS